MYRWVSTFTVIPKTMWNLAAQNITANLSTAADFFSFFKIYDQWTPSNVEINSIPAARTQPLLPSCLPGSLLAARKVPQMIQRQQIHGVATPQASGTERLSCQHFSLSSKEKEATQQPASRAKQLKPLLQISQSRRRATIHFFIHGRYLCPTSLAGKSSKHNYAWNRGAIKEKTKFHKRYQACPQGNRWERPCLGAFVMCSNNFARVVHRKSLLSSLIETQPILPRPPLPKPSLAYMHNDKDLALIFTCRWMWWKWGSKMDYHNNTINWL